MPISEDQYRKLKREVEAAKDEAQRARGALEQLTSRLKEEYDCKDVKEAKRKLDQLEQDVAEAETNFDKVLKDYQKKWNG